MSSIIELSTIYISTLLLIKTSLYSKNLLIPFIYCFIRIEVATDEILVGYKQIGKIQTILSPINKYSNYNLLHNLIIIYNKIDI